MLHDYFRERDGERRNADHNYGQKIGSQAGFIDQCFHAATSFLETEDYNQGFDNGVDHRKDRAAAERRAAELAEQLSEVISLMQERIAEEEYEEARTATLEARAEALRVFERSISRREEKLAKMQAMRPDSRLTRELEGQIEAFKSLYAHLVSSEDISSYFVDQIEEQGALIRDLELRCERELARKPRSGHSSPARLAAIAKANARGGKHDYEDEEGIHSVSVNGDSNNYTITTLTYKDRAAYEDAKEITKAYKRLSEGA